ncbi:MULTISPECIES: cupin domain-containing protein [Azospirillum]|uniref:Cupin domain-containing protein n=1 Tax=Azospirillum brasilense TaxID=192 RepID=A0A4D8QRE3_AZOBR|nr:MULTISPECIES: cupin domain-containing protein [Azospirillum]MDW7557630.1 cupin domain-containing protein [Azospirillum brasilense]MDW7597304.1 cupin domain-containing protein [Azospirillum brasilense]MDW7632477.1 cupin domain-containing protein [Azospirillum brasilense]MDX5950231.1 cupin domain-containing protein [Azospirillum brasilense]NUB12823.1 cupin domain-containing protein [Azospirillum brasilense]
MKKLLLSLLVASLPLQGAVADPHHTGRTGGVKVTLVYEHPLPNLPNKSVKGVLVEYEPGAVNPAHTHAKSALIYATVLEGAVLNQLNGGPVRTFTKGQNFTELPGDRHDVSANASQTEPAKLLAVFVVDTDDTVLTTPLAR